MREFYYNIQFQEDGSVHTRVNDIAVHGTRSVIGKTCSVKFVALVSNITTKKCAGVFKKVIKNDYQLVFEFVNKTLLPRT